MRRLPATLSWPLYIVIGAARAFGANCPAPGTYRTTNDFNINNAVDQSVSFNIDHGTGDQLRVNAPLQLFPYVNVACSIRGTLVRIFVGSGIYNGGVETEPPKRLGEYRTAPDGMSKNPSRTTVDHRGNAWITNRDEFGLSPAGSTTPKGSITRIALLEGGTRGTKDEVTGLFTPDPTNPPPTTPGQWLKEPFSYESVPWQELDRDDDGLIKTSYGLGNILAWPNTNGHDTHGCHNSADPAKACLTEDELITNYTRVYGTGTRTVAVDAVNDVWVGGWETGAATRHHEKLSGATGLPIPFTVFDYGCGGYGGLIDHQGVLWSTRSLLRFDPAAPYSEFCFGDGSSQTCRPQVPGNYGIALDPVAGQIWSSGRVDASSNSYTDGAENGTGLIC